MDQSGISVEENEQADSRSERRDEPVVLKKHLKKAICGFVCNGTSRNKRHITFAFKKYVNKQKDRKLGRESVTFITKQEGDTLG